MMDRCLIIIPASINWQDICPIAPPTLMPIGEKIPFGIHHIINPATTPPLKEKKNVGVNMPPASAEPMITLLITTKSAHRPPNE